LKKVNPIQGIIYYIQKWPTNQVINMTLNQRVSQDVAYLQIANTIKISPAALLCTEVHSVQQKSKGLKFSKSLSGSDLKYSCHHNSSVLLPKYLCVRGVSLYCIHYNQSRPVYVNQRQQYVSKGETN